MHIHTKSMAYLQLLKQKWNRCTARISRVSCQWWAMGGGWLAGHLMLTLTGSCSCGQKQLELVGWLGLSLQPDFIVFYVCRISFFDARVTVNQPNLVEHSKWLLNTTSQKPGHQMEVAESSSYTESRPANLYPPWSFKWSWNLISFTQFFGIHPCIRLVIWGRGGKGRHRGVLLYVCCDVVVCKDVHEQWKHIQYLIFFFSTPGNTWESQTYVIT